MITKIKPPSSFHLTAFYPQAQLQSFNPHSFTSFSPSSAGGMMYTGLQSDHNTSSVLLLALHFFLPPQPAPAWLLLRLKFLSGKPVPQRAQLHALQLPRGNTSTLRSSTGYSVDNCSCMFPLLRMEGIAAPPRASPQAAGASLLQQLQHLLSPCSLELALTSCPQAPLTTAASSCQYLEFSRAQ